MQEIKIGRFVDHLQPEDLATVHRLNITHGIGVYVVKADGIMSMMDRTRTQAIRRAVDYLDIVISMKENSDVWILTSSGSL